MYCLNGKPPYFKTIQEARRVAIGMDPHPDSRRTKIFRIRHVITDHEGNLVGGVVDQVEGRGDEQFYAKGDNFLALINPDGSLVGEYYEIGVGSQGKFLIMGNDGIDPIPFPTRVSMLRFFIKVASQEELYDGYVAKVSEEGKDYPTYLMRVDRKTLVYGSDEMGWHKIKAGGKLATGEFKATDDQKRGMIEGRKAQGFPVSGYEGARA